MKSISSPRRLALYGATGSIGRQTLDVVRRLGGFEVVVLSAGSNWQELVKLAQEWHPQWVVISEPAYVHYVRENLQGLDVKILSGPDALAESALLADYDICLNGLVGVAGLQPSWQALSRGIDVALANKESLVLAGELLIPTAARTGARILPVDSEHSAIFQCLLGEDRASVKRIILTASGGPFLNWTTEQIAAATPEQALAHPTWKMGPKITIDSATLMNKGLEVVEAFHLFGFKSEQIEVRIHPQSIVHSLVEFEDGSFKAYLSKPDMRLPIQLALTYPHRQPLEINKDDPVQWPPLTFAEVDRERFPCLMLGYEVLRRGGTAGAVLNGADEAAVEAFLNRQIGFNDIPQLISQALDQHQPQPVESIDQILEFDRQARRQVWEWMGLRAKGSRL